MCVKRCIHFTPPASCVTLVVSNEDAGWWESPRMYASVAHFILLEVRSSHSEVAFHIVAKCRTQDCTTLIKTAVGHVFMWCCERVVWKYAENHLRFLSVALWIKWCRNLLNIRRNVFASVFESTWLIMFLFSYPPVEGYNFPITPETKMMISHVQNTWTCLALLHAKTIGKTGKLANCVKLLLGLIPHQLYVMVSKNLSLMLLSSLGLIPHQPYMWLSCLLLLGLIPHQPYMWRRCHVCCFCWGLSLTSSLGLIPLQLYMSW